MKRLSVGVVGCGNICPQYFKHLAQYDFVEVRACADLMCDRAAARASEFAVPRVLTAEQLLADPDIDIVLNLTTPRGHTELNLAAIAAGKHVYVEKPLALDRDAGRRVMDAARARGVRVGCAPDTFLGGGGQTCRKLIDDGAIGQPVAATAFMTCHGHESWHPDPEFYYQVGGGPMLDMGPYYLTALVNLIGPVRRVAGATRITFPERTITSQPKRGARIKVEVPTHVAGLVEFANGAIGTIVTSFDVWHANLPRIEIYGEQGTINVPDPNTFGGDVLLRKAGDKDWTRVPHTHPTAVGRGIGLADLANAVRCNRPHRASGELAMHVLDVMQSFEDSSRCGRRVEITSVCTRPEALPAGLPVGQLDS